MKRRRKKLMVIIPVAVVCVAGVGTVGYFKVAHTKPVQNVTVQAQSAEAKKGNLSKTIVGTGNLELAEAEDQDAPSGLEISEVMVESGDEVKEGDVLAVVDESSILEAMEQVQDEISQLDESIQEYQDSDEENVIESSVSGRVKKINVSAGSDVSDTMVSDGALMVLSLDGKMAVSLSGVSGVSAGDSVTVTLSSGTQVTGTVDSVSGKDCVVTLTDNGTTYGDTVTVTDSSGQELGSGELTIHEPLEITGTSGTVSAVNVSENASVSEGTTLLTLEGSANETQYQELLAKREARTATLKKLIQLKADPEIEAEISGTVQSVNVSAGSSTTTDSSSGSSSGSSGSGKTVSQMSYVVSGSVSVVRCSDTGAAVSSDSVTDISESDMNSQEAGETDTEQQTEIVALASSDAYFSSDVDGEEDSSGEDTAETSTTLQFAIATEGTSTASSLVIAAPVTGQMPVTSVSATDGSYTGTVAWNPGDGSFQEKTVYQAVVTLTAGDGYVFQAGSISQIALGTVSGISVSQDGKSMSFQITFPETAAAEDIKKDDSGNGNDSTTDGKSTDDNKDNDADQVTDGADGQSGTDSADNGTDSASGNSGTDGNSTQSGNNQSGGSAASGNSGGTSVSDASGSSSGASQTGDSQETDSSTSGTELSASEYSTDVALFTISPDDTMTLEVSVDEQDINSVEIGQEAVVTFDAIEDEEFTGEVTEIGNTASVNGGVAKYTVSVSVPKDEELKQGMNASATITIENRENVITIPVNALQEKGDKVFVYTEKDEDGNLSGETEVTTGLSDGTTVEITEGLSEGDTVYYNKSGNTDSGSGNDSGMPDGMGDFGDMSGGPGGNSDSGNSGGPGGNGGGPGGSGSSGGNGGGTPPNM
ncbi:HlyD family efflux transporter periplasmic adaptor subunit [Blautia sp. MSJ-36]|uniref:HlyD family efflux transporter periplasmic adaptor subunit n=1 Tax=Blautia sp. MSJ-36 TaxID=2841530 RepID=UPI001C10E05B|nr:biotin/lipoyl-binding protein [Blautia sp. MSJ-36]MBU5445812.1 HlyD family efflux transporter periplasmic adaptor subunit [Blautia sp. MSJ-36]